MVTSTQAHAYLTTYRTSYEPIYTEGQKTPVGSKLRPGISRNTKLASDAALLALLDACHSLLKTAAMRAYANIDEATLDAIIDDAVSIKALDFKIEGKAVLTTWLSTVVFNDASKERDRARNQQEFASTPISDDADDQSPRSLFDQSSDAHLWTTQSAPVGSTDAFANTLRAIVYRVACERFPEDADLITEIAVIRDLEAALDELPLMPRKEVAERYGLSEWRTRTLTDRATELLREAASNFRAQPVEQSGKVSA